MTRKLRLLFLTLVSTMLHAEQTSRRRRAVALQQSAAQAPQGEVRLRADRYLARARAEVVGPLQHRRLRLVRLRRRPGHDQPPRRPRRPAKAQQEGQGLRQGRLLRQDARRKSSSRSTRSSTCSWRSSTSPSEVKAAVKPDMTPEQAFEARRGVIAKIEEESAQEDRPAQRRRHALPGRPVPPLPLQTLHRRPPGLRPGAADRLLRRRSGQLRLSALRSRRLLLPRLRGRQAGQDRALSQVEQGRRRRTTSWSSSPAIPATPIGSTPSPTWNTSATSAIRSPCSGSTAWK